MSFLWSYIDWLIGIFLFVFILQFLKQGWLFYRQNQYVDVEHVLFEIKIPRIIERGPKAMEQFFSGLHAFRNIAGSIGEKYYDGEVTREFSFELLGTNGSVHLFMYVPGMYSDSIKSLLYAQYNDLEIIEQKEDYLDLLPRSYDDLKLLGYDLYGQEVYLGSPDFHPVKTYIEFEEKTADERIVDPIAFFMEVVSNMAQDETLMVQFVISPEDEDWKEGGRTMMKRMQEKRKVFEGGVFKGRSEQETEAEKQTAKAINRKISKVGFATLVRYVHITPTANFNNFFGYRSFFTFFNQLSSRNNRFEKNTKVWTKIDWYDFPFIFSNRRLLERKREIYKEYLWRYTPEEFFIGNLFRSNFWRLNFNHKMSVLNTEELATLFHPPTNVVITTGLMDRVESKRLAPPSNLPN